MSAVVLNLQNHAVMNERTIIYKCYACLHVDTTRAVEALIYFYILYSLSLLLFTLKPEHLFFPVIYFISNKKNDTMNDWR